MNEASGKIGRWLDISCPRCGARLNTWDVRVSKALGYLKYQVCEGCICKEYGQDVREFRDYMSAYLGMRPCIGI